MCVRFFLLLTLCLCTDAFAWGPRGHEVTGAVADQLLQPNAAQQVQALLGMPLRVASTWADCVKDVKKSSSGGFAYKPMAQYHAACVAFETPEGEARMVDYATRNWDNCPHPTGR